MRVHDSHAYRKMDVTKERKRHIRNRSIVLQAVRVEWRLFQKWSDNDRFKHVRERTRASGIIDHMRNIRKQHQAHK